MCVAVNFFNKKNTRKKNTADGDVGEHVAGTTFSETQTKNWTTITDSVRMKKIMVSDELIGSGLDADEILSIALHAHGYSDKKIGKMLSMPVKFIRQTLQENKTLVNSSRACMRTAPYGANINKKIDVGVDFIELFPSDFVQSEKFVQTWSDWITFRQEKKKPLTKTAAKRQANKLAALAIDVACAIIDRSIDADWVGLFPPEAARIDVKLTTHARRITEQMPIQINEAAHVVQELSSYAATSGDDLLFNRLDLDSWIGEYISNGNPVLPGSNGWVSFVQRVHSKHGTDH